MDSNIISNGGFASFGSDWALSGHVGASSNRLHYSQGDTANDGVAQQNFTMHPDVNYTLTLEYYNSGAAIDQTVLVEVIDVSSGAVIASETSTTNSPTPTS